MQHLLQCWFFVEQIFPIIMPPTSKKLQEHIGFGLCVRLSKTACWGLEISYMDSSWKNSWHVFFLVWVISLSGVMPLRKNQNEFWCMPYLTNRACLGFEISCMDSSWKNSWSIFFFLVRFISLSGVMPLWKNQNEILSARYLEKNLSKGLETWWADRRCWVDYLIKLKIILFFRSYGPLKFGHFKVQMTKIYIPVSSLQI